MGFISKSYLSTQLTNFSKRIEEVFTKKGHKHTKSDITDFPTSLPANGGNSSTVNSHTVNADVPSGAVFTDTDTWRPIGTGANDAAAGNHTHSNYIPTSGGVTVNGTIKFYGAEQRFCPLGESYNDPMPGYAAAIKASGTSVFQNICLKDGIRPSGASTSTYPVVYKESGTWADFGYTASDGTWGSSNNKYVRQGDLMICSAELKGTRGSSGVTLTINNSFPTSFTSAQLISAVAYQPYIGYKTGTPQTDNTITFSGLNAINGAPSVFLNIVYRVE